MSTSSVQASETKPIDCSHARCARRSSLIDTIKAIVQKQVVARAFFEVHNELDTRKLSVGVPMGCLEEESCDPLDLRGHTLTASLTGSGQKLMTQITVTQRPLDKQIQNE